VFTPDYALLPLSEVSSYISANQHLPGVEKGTNMQANGLGLGAFSMTLLRKVEELTLYVLKQQEEIDQLKARL
jgi:UDP-N-acetylglucosamine pyrophosphorylase